MLRHPLLLKYRIMKKFLYSLAIALVIVFIGACSQNGSADYDADECRDLSIKIETRQDLSDADYSKIIAQDEAILKYLISKSKEISELPADDRAAAWRNLTSDPEYLERFGYMFTLGSALYQAQLDGRLNHRNLSAYEHLDKYNSALASYSTKY